MPRGLAKPARAPAPPCVIGLEELVSLPEWGIFALPAKVDTGALTCALHVEGAELLRDGKIRFRAVLDASPGGRRVDLEAQLARRGWVRPSHGVPRQRFFVETTLRLGPVERRVEIGLVDRAEMRFRMLLGRSALQGEFLIDVGRRHVLTAPAR